MIESVLACGWSCTADGLAARGCVTRRATPRNMRSKSGVVGTLRSLAHVLESIKYQASALDLMFGRGEHATWPARLLKAGGSRCLMSDVRANGGRSPAPTRPVAFVWNRDRGPHRCCRI